MLKIRHVFMMLGMLLYPLASLAEVSVSIGINLPVYPNLVLIPGYPVYYAPRLQANFFFYDGMYWVYQNDGWYTSSWYNGPWWFVSEEEVPLFVLRIPVRYYRQPPAFFIGWRADAPPRWGDHWGRDWEQHRSGWDRWNRQTVPAPAPLPVYQRQYSRDRYPEQVQQQQQLQQQHYRFQSRDPVARQYDQAVQPARQINPQQRGIPDERGARQQDIQRQQTAPVAPHSPVQRPAPESTRQPQYHTPSPVPVQQELPRGQENRQQNIQLPRQQNAPVVPRPEQQIQRQAAPRQDHAQPPAPVQREQSRGQAQQGKEAPHGPGQERGQERGRDRND